MEIQQLFSVPLAIGHISTKNFALLHDLTQEELQPHLGDTHGDVSLNIKLLQKPKYRSLEAEIHDKVRSFAVNILGEQDQTWKSPLSWLSVKHPGQRHEKHHHPNSMISTVLWFGDMNKSVPAIEFHHPSSEFGYRAFMENRPNTITEFNSKTYTMPVEHGLLAIFPSWLPHSVPMNETDYPRYSLAANWMPSKGVGEDSSLTRLDFY